MRTHYLPTDLVIDCEPPHTYKEIEWIVSEAGYVIGFQSDCSEAQWARIIDEVEASLSVWIAILDAEYEQMRA